MALIKCQDCDAEISEHASVCPKCGCPVPTVTYCRCCGNKIENSNFCPVCGFSCNMQYYNYGVVHNARKMCDTALASGIMGIMSLIMFFPVFSIISLILGISSLGKIRQENLDGRGWAICGIVTSIIELLIIALIIFLAILFYDKL